jgi:hypothetical protein
MNDGFARWQGSDLSRWLAPEPRVQWLLAWERQGPIGLGDHPYLGTRFLIVEDDHRNALALSSLLERGRGEVAVAESGFDAITALEDGSPIDLVLMDIMMPGMDGYDTMRAIRRRERFKTLPIIAVTAKDIDGERQRCLDAGASDFLPKPVVVSHLLSIVEPWLPRSQSRS